MTFAESLAGDLRRFNKTHQDFAHDLGVSITSVSRWLNSHTTPNKLTLKAISNLIERYENDQLANAS